MKRGSYARRACNHCRRRKSKCDGCEPTCASCRLSGHECSWGPESAKKPTTKQYVDSLKKMNRQLDRRVKILEQQLAHCTRRPVEQVAQDALSLALRIPDQGSPSSYSGQPSPGSTHSEPVFPKTEEQDDIDQIIAPTQHLHLGNDGLQLYGPTSIFRLAPTTPERPNFPEEVVNGYADAYRSLYQESILFNSEIDWSRHLPRVPLTLLEHDRLLGLLFRFFTSWGLRVIPKLFQRDMHRCLSLPSSLPPLNTAHYSPMLHNALLAVATAFSDDPAIRDPLTRKRFADKAKSYLEDECERPKLSAMTALSILANYHSSENHATLGYIYFGICARMSQALGLGIDCSPWVETGLITHAGMMDRNWALWTTFCQDTTWSLYVGRDFCTASSVDPDTIPVPFVSPELDQFLGSWPNGEKVAPDHISGTFSATCSLMQIARDIADVVSNFSRLGDRYEANEFRIAQMDLKLSTWKNDLPSEIDFVKSNPCAPQPHQLMLHMTYHWLTILLHRPFYRRRRSCEDLNDYTDHIRPCNRAAAEIMELAQIWRAHFKLRCVPITMIQVISAAATIFVVAAVQAVSGPRVAHGALESAEKNAETAIQYLREIGESFASATSIADILQHLLQQQVQTRKTRRSPGASSPGVPIVPWQHPSSPSVYDTRGNMDSALSWLEPSGAPIDSVHTSFPDSQPMVGYPSRQYSSLAGALSPGAPLGYFGDGLGETPYLPAGGPFSEMNIGGILGAGPGSMFPTEPLMMFGSSQEVFNPSYLGATNLYPPPH
ncbi:hypothetical protein EDB87DRAFT_1595180 [Lactarius vividus]|nr:hypothetical protein EDB87DRAFT_1595180 [Lactarius vividus]